MVAPQTVELDDGRAADGDGSPAADGGESLFHRLARAVRAAPRDFPDQAALARAARSTRAGLRDLLLTHAHLAPDPWLERERVRYASLLLLDRRGAIAETAEAAGFRDEAAFRRAFLSSTCMQPEAYRALGSSTDFALQLPPRYRAAEVLAYHARDPESRCEKVTGARLSKALATPDGLAVLEISLARGAATCVVHRSARLGPDSMRFAHAVAVRMLGLTADVAGFEARAARDRRLRALVARRPGLRLPLAATPFDGLCWAIIGQQINVRFASVLRRELIGLAGEPVQGFLTHPSPESVAALDPLDLRRRRFSRAKAEYLIGAAQAVVAGRVAPDSMHEGSVVAAERSLTSVRGIGTWTARYMLMRGAGFADCAPVGDAALAAALARLHGAAERPGPKETEALMRPYAPNRSLATCHLWASLRD